MKNRYIFAVIIGVVMLLTACVKEELSMGIPDGAIMLTTEDFHGDGAKTSVSGKTVQWVDKDSLRFYVASLNAVDRLVHVANGQAYIPMALSGNSGNPIRGYYPRSIITATGASDNASSPTVVIPSSYESSYSGGRQIIGLPMVGKAQIGDKTIRFKHLTAAVMVVVRNESGTGLVIDDVVVSSSTSKLSGTMTLDLTDDEDLGVTRQSGSGSVTVNLSGATLYDNENDTIQVPILPVNGGEDLTITIHTHVYSEPYHTLIFDHTTSVPNNLDRNMMLTARCKLHNGSGNHVTDFNALTTPLTFEAKEANTTVTFDLYKNSWDFNVEYSRDGVNWTMWNGSYVATLDNVGDKISFRGEHNAYADLNNSSHITCSKDCYVYGNVMSLIGWEIFNYTTTLTEPYAFRQLFCNDTHIFSHPAKALALPATTLTNNCYLQMFYGCTNLTTAPALPATTMKERCYQQMFSGCTNLTTAPALPAMNLADDCYQNMFRDCSSLATAPALSATVLADNCYLGMFSGCTSLTTAPALPATTLDTNCYSFMFSGCTSLTTAPALPATTLYYACYSSMFNGCTSLTTAPALPATTLANVCYYNMFNGCTSLTKAPTLRATTLVPFCYLMMFNGCSNLSSVTCLATDLSAQQCTKNWLNGVAATGTFKKDVSIPAGSGTDGYYTVGYYWPTNSVDGIPANWTIEDY